MSLSHLLSAQEVCRLTGYTRPSYQARYCRENGIRFTISGAGEVIIAAAALNEIAQQELTEPDFRCFDAA
jgi:hypothetical protein